METTMDQICTSDVFRASYHLTKQDRYFKVGLNSKGEKCFLIKGEGVCSDDMEYFTGNSAVSPLALKDKFLMLEKVSRQPLSLLDPYLLSSETDDLDMLDDFELDLPDDFELTDDDIFMMDDESFEEI